MTLLEFSDNLKRRSTYLKIYDICDIFRENIIFEGTASMLSHSVFFQKNNKVELFSILFEDRTYIITISGDIK